MSYKFNPLNPFVNLMRTGQVEKYRKSTKRVKKFDISITIRREMGGDISASCGQLRRSVTQENNY